MTLKIQSCQEYVVPAQKFPLLRVRRDAQIN
jgi:hypothetical protein